MNITPNVHAMIVAAGRGSRFGASIAKQYTMLQGQTLLQHSVARLASSTYIDRCLLVVAADDSTAQTLNFALPIHYAMGGAERWQSVQAGVKAIIEAGATTQIWLLFMMLRVLRSPVMILKRSSKRRCSLWRYLSDTGGHFKGVLSPVYRSIACRDPVVNLTVSSSPHSYAKCTIDRRHMWQAQTPQVFRLGQLQKVLTYVAEHELTITDEASAFECLELPIRLVTGSRQNIKLTYPDDAILLAAIMNAQF
ncbi:LOW QUALITY PROTEIN: 2-C-methyl-D-erythritol 4-phosphate cytidylyltransferase [Psychrobacter sp. JCM 18902]|nr:LOW QUALITY PROTEIN: 2-C-methyl-D-erythritol 4-phosphate cytidylyltransferase [Psychrobacter sp. JCM 18902]